MRIYWVTYRMATLAAKQGQVAAAKMSVRKWENYCNCSLQQLKKEEEIARRDSDCADFQECALCKFIPGRGCYDCVLATYKRGSCLDDFDSYWKNANAALEAFQVNPTKPIFKKFQQKAKPMLNLLRRALKKAKKLNNV